jgi:hypothetical protein
MTLPYNQDLKSNLVVWISRDYLEIIVAIAIFTIFVIKYQDWAYMYNYHAFYPFRFDYSSICIGGGCP